jgi:nucleoside-diphosphate-sugar epimerase
MHAVVHADDSLATTGCVPWSAGQGRVNVAMTAALLLAAREAGVLRLVHISTAELYASAPEAALTACRDMPLIGGFLRLLALSSAEVCDEERMPARALLPRAEWSALPLPAASTSAYTYTKLQAEVAVTEAYLAGLGTVTLRPSTVLSPALTSGTIARLLATRGRPLVAGANHACIDFTHVDNVAHAVALALRAPATVHGRTYHIGSHEPMRLWSVIEQLRERLGMLQRSAPPRSVSFLLAYSAVGMCEALCNK